MLGAPPSVGYTRLLFRGRIHFQEACLAAASFDPCPHIIVPEHLLCHCNLRSLPRQLGRVPPPKRVASILVASAMLSIFFFLLLSVQARAATVSADVSEVRPGPISVTASTDTLSV